MKGASRFSKKVRSTNCYYGKVNDLLYSASSGVSRDFENWRPSSVKTYYNNGRAQRATSYSGYISPPLGSETICTYSGRGMVGNNCEHWKQQVINLPFFLASWAYDVTIGTQYSSTYYCSYWRVPMFGTYYRDAVQHAHSHGVVNDQMFSARAYWSMRPKLESGVSLINSMFELKDFSDAAQFLTSPRGLFRVLAGERKSLLSMLTSIGEGHSLAYTPSVRKGAKRLHRYVHSKSVGEHMSDITKHSTKATASGILTYNLAIMPTIRDALAIHAASQKRAYEEIRNFESYGDDGSTSHYSENETVFTDVTPGSLNNYCYGTGKLIRRTRTATMTSYYKVLWQRFEDMYPKWWGLEVGADEVWNMLPLSFVLDYVMTIGKSLEYMDRDPRIKVLATEYMESTKVTAELGTYIIQSYRTPQLVIDDEYINPRRQSKCHLVSGTCGKYYKRQIMEPYKGPALPKLKLPSATQAANMLSLARCLIF